jgi:hypothetical protein
MADLDAGALFSVKGLVAIITGGGTGELNRNVYVHMLIKSQESD